MKFGVNAFLWTGHFGSADFALLPQIREHGFDGVEVALFRPSQFEATAIRRALEASKLECTVCGVFPKEFSLVDSDPAVRQRTRAHLSDCIKATAEAGAASSRDRSTLPWAICPAAAVRPMSGNGSWKPTRNWDLFWPATMFSWASSRSI